jgi:alpha-glucosidase
MLPFLYTTLGEAHRTGVPLFRPLVLNYQDDPNTHNIDDQFMIGDDLLVAPVLKPDVTSRRVYLPAGTWYDYWTNKRHTGGTTITVDAPLDVVPIFVRGGAILPIGPMLNYVGEKPTDPVTFNIYPDDAGSASGRLYEDDGLSPAYKRGEFRRTALAAKRAGRGFLVSVGTPEGTYNPGPRTFNFIVKSLGPAAKPLILKDEGRAREVEIK